MCVNSAVYKVSYVHKKSVYPQVSEYLVVKQLLDAVKRILARPPTRMKRLSIAQVWSLLTRLEWGMITDLQLAAVLALGRLTPPISGQSELWSITCCNLLGKT